MLVSFEVVDDGFGRGVKSVDGAKRTTQQSSRQAYENVISAAVDEFVCVYGDAVFTQAYEDTTMDELELRV
ncbi:hypothetical protein Moror_13371 [Moniliophthora roreri MCA 2997]|uniref:Uncharacterized protein n=1 Tax=Moniliophthora roreri (strain MCA 2997) TaxID=1381753 RepID=V2XNL4_MONRO|nr:hypothetical protein Moror_13371 [Moniliophthora roreri MCA 2997]